MLFPKEEEEYREWFHGAAFDDVRLQRIGLPKWCPTATDSHQERIRWFHIAGTWCSSLVQTSGHGVRSQALLHLKH